MTNPPHTPTNAVDSIRRATQPGLQPVASSEQSQAWRSEQGKAHRVFAEKAKHIAALSAARRRTQPLVRDFLRNPLVRLSASLRALGGDPERSVAHALCQRVDPWTAQPPAVSWLPKAKPDGSARPICILPPEMKAVHIMLAAAIAAQFQPSAAVYGIDDYGRDDAARALKALQNAGFTSLGKVDIVNCFQSISPDALYQLPLPKEVIRRTLDTRNLTFIRREPRDHNRGHSLHLHQSHSPSRPRGLMQGSPASSVILACLLNDLPQGEDVAVLLCFDNIAVAARDAAGCRAMVDTLADYLSRCPAGPLALCPPVYADNTPMEFLGYLFDPTRPDIGLAEGARARLERRLGPAEEADILGRTAFPLRTWRTLRDFASGFPATEAQGEEFAFYVETTQDTADASDSPFIAYLHQHVLAQRGTPEGDVFHALMRQHPREKTT